MSKIKMKKHGLVLGDINNGGEWIATLRLMNEMKKLRESPVFFLVAFSGQKNQLYADIFDQVKYLSCVKSKPPFSFIKQLYKNFVNSRKILQEMTFNREKIDYILATNHLLILPLLTLKKYKNIPVIYSFHGIRSLPFLNLTNFNYREIIVKILERIALLSSTVIVTPSEFGKRYIQSILGVFNKFKNISILPNFVPEEFFNKVPSKELNRYKRRFGIPESAKLILFSSRLAQFKGLENLITAFARFVDSYPNSILIIAYPISDQTQSVYSALTDQLKNSRLIEKVVLIPDSPIKQLMALYQMADISVLPSEFEISPLVLLESLASGTPLIGTDVGNVAEVLSQVDNKLLLENNNPESICDKLYYFFGLSISNRKSLNKRSVNAALKYSSERSVNLFNKILSSLS